MSGDYAAVPAPQATEAPELDPLALVLADAIRDQIWTASATSSRSMQAEVGFSELGTACPRRLAYRLRGAAPVSHADPLRSVVGTGGHLILAEFYRRIDAGTGRYLVEEPVWYRGVPGTADLFDRRRKVVIDWKFKALAKVRRARREGPSSDYRIQVHGYGTALRARGEDVTHVAIAYIPVDGDLADIYIWIEPLDPSIVDAAISALASMAVDPVTAPASPSPLCGWCPHHNPSLTQPTQTACPGKNEIKETATA